MPQIPKAIYALVITFAYGLIAYFWPDVPFSQDVFSLIVIAALGALGVEISAEVREVKSAMKRNGFM